MKGSPKADATLPTTGCRKASVGHGSAFQSVATSSDVGRACRLGCVEESGSALSENSVVSHSSMSSTAASRSVVAAQSKDQPQATAPVCQWSSVRHRRLHATEEAQRKGEAREVTPGFAGEGARAVQLTEANLKASTIERQNADSSYEELWQSRIGLLAEEPLPPLVVAAAHEVVEGNNCKAERRTSSTPPSAVSMQASALTGSGCAPIDEPMPEYVELWQRRLDIFFDDESSQMDVVYASLCASATKCSSPTKVDDKKELDFDMEELKQDLTKWLSPEQMASFGLQVETDHEKTRGRAQSGCGLCCAVVAAAASILVPILAVSWRGP